MRCQVLINCFQDLGEEVTSSVYLVLNVIA